MVSIAYSYSDHLVEINSSLSWLCVVHTPTSLAESGADLYSPESCDYLRFSGQMSGDCVGVEVSFNQDLSTTIPEIRALKH